MSTFHSVLKAVNECFQLMSSAEGVENNENARTWRLGNQRVQRHQCVLVRAELGRPAI